MGRLAFQVPIGLNEVLSGTGGAGHTAEMVVEDGAVSSRAGD
jgi:hypothetical protein